MSYTNTYQRINWQNLPSEATALNDVNLNKMDAEIYAHGEQFETVDTALGHKVDKESGKGLSAIKTLSISTSANTGTNIASISYKDQNNLTVGYTIKNGVVVDSALSSSSENPVQNKVVKSAVDAKSTVSISDTLVTGDTIANLTINGTTTAIKAPLVEVDDTPSSTSENPLQNKAIYEMLNNLLPEGSESGNPISISDASGLNAKACSVDLLPIQDLHGYESPWVGGAGKNKVPISDWFTAGETKVQDGITLTFLANGKIGISGTNTSSSATMLYLSNAGSNPPYHVWKVPSGQYTLSWNGIANTNVNLITSGGGNNGFEYTSLSSSSKTKTSTVSDGTKPFSYLIIQVGAGVQIPSNSVLEIQLEQGATATSYAPYENICPISGRNSVELKRTGVNQWDEQWESGSYRSADGTPSVDNSRIRSKNRVEVLSDSLYLVTLASTIIFMYDATDTYLGYKSVNGSGIITPITWYANTKYIRFSVGSSTNPVTTYTSGIAINYPSTATTYEPYQGETYTETLGQTVYGGNVDFVNGTATIDRAFIEYDGSNDENWDISSTSGNPVARIVKPSSITTNIICNSFERVGSSSALGESGKYYIGGSNLVFSWSGTLAEWKTYISATPIQLCWVLATPTTLALTPEQISLLKGNNVVSTDGDNIKLVYSADIKAWVENQLQS